ncbi:MAG: hypothetical protein NT154_40465, partial [Verrucomicrobia bacterium]|nr:hypothetical protein [Verrucomicrobiota bacterium]
KITDGSQPPVTLNLSLSAAADSHSFHRFACPLLLLSRPKAQSAACPQQGPMETSIDIRRAAEPLPNG